MIPYKEFFSRIKSLPSTSDQYNSINQFLELSDIYDHIGESADICWWFDDVRCNDCKEFMSLKKVLQDAKFHAQHFYSGQ